MDIQKLRAETPGVQHKMHLNNAGASMQPSAVIEAIRTYMDEEITNGGYEIEFTRQADIKGYYSAVAQLLNTKAKNIAHTNNATEGFNKALSAISFSEGDVILTTDDDYSSSHIAFINLQKRHRVKVMRAAKLPSGGVDVNDVERLVKKHRPKIVTVAHVPTNSGLVQDVENVGSICREHDIWYLVDACQSAGQIPLDIEKIGCDFLSATMRKWLRGPRGCGFLFASDRAIDAGLEPYFPDLGGADWVAADLYKMHDDASRFSYWEKNYSLLIGGKTAAEYALSLGLEEIEKRVSELANYTRQQIESVAGWQVLDQGTKKCGIVTAYHPTARPGKISKAMKAANINLGFARTFNALIDFQEKGVEWAMRVSPHYYNTKEEIDEMVEVLSQN